MRKAHANANEIHKAKTTTILPKIWVRASCRREKVVSLRALILHDDDDDDDDNNNNNNNTYFGKC
jgi:hypothetical protein